MFCQRRRDTFEGRRDPVQYMTPTDQLGITLIQTPLHWEQPEANRAHFATKISQLSDQTDLIVLPEMFTTGFSMNASQLAESMDGPTVKWMTEHAAATQSCIMGSVIISDEGQYFNRLILARPDGEIEHYDKRHLFTFASEDKHYTPGNQRLITSIKGWRICPLVCYDLRFPIWSRNIEFGSTATSPVYDVLVYVANWPEVRSRPWGALLEARAHENQSYVVGVNRVGQDGNEIQYSGDSVVFNPRGQRLDNIKPKREAIKTLYLKWDELSQFRKKFPVSNDADPAQLLQ